MSNFLRDFKKFTSKRLAEAIVQIPESRWEWLLHKFQYLAKSTGRAKDYKLWQDGDHAICVDDAFITPQKVDYIHNNPVAAMIEAEPQHYLFSSANVYAGSMQSLVKISLYDAADTAIG